MRVETCKLLLLSLAITANAHAARTIALFNGKDLTGWDGVVASRGANADGSAKIGSVWSARNGLLHCAAGPDHFSWLHTVQDYTSFRLHLEWRWGEPDPETRKKSKNIYNSGVFLRAVPWSVATPQFPMPATFELQILPPSEDTGDIWLMGDNHPNFKAERDPVGQTRAKRFPKSKFNEKPLGQWNAYDVIFDGDKLSLKVNGVQVNAGSGAAVTPGKIGMECENTPIDFRNIRLTPIGK
jgi:hypothetical protein